MNVLPNVYICSHGKKSVASWGDSKMHTSSSIVNSQRMLTEISESGAIAKIRIWVESDTVLKK